MSRIRTELVRRPLQFLAVLVAAVALWQAIAPVSKRPANAATVPQAQRIDTAVPKTTPIEQIRPGMRVVAGTPELANSPSSDTIITPPEWRMFCLRMEKADGGFLEVELLRPIEWALVQALDRAEQVGDRGIDLPRPLSVGSDELALAEIVLGKQLNLDLPELGAAGAAVVSEIRPCPAIESARGPNSRLVTGTFRHSAANVLDIQVQGEESSIGTTSNHPFWSDDRKAFVEAGELRVGEKLRRSDGTLTKVERVERRRGDCVEVFNLEIDIDHTYHVGKTGVLVHNTYYSDNGLAVIGTYPGYLKRATDLGASRFNIGKLWGTRYSVETANAMNLRFLDKIAAMRQKVILSLPRGDIQPTSKGLNMEIEYLTNTLGYRWVNQWALYPPPL